MRKLLLLLLSFLSINAIAQNKDTTQVNADANPYNILVVVDGSVYKGTIESINPQIIESVNVLRGANPTVTFRSRAVNGVILVTTKNAGKQDLIQKPSNEASVVSISPANKPLIIVDDVVYDGDINKLNDKNILSVDVLKGTSAIAIYGATASNGAITILTKQYYQVRIQNELSLKSKAYKKYLQHLDYLMVYKINDTPLHGNTYDIAKQIADIPEEKILEVETKRVNYAGVDNVVVNIKTKK
jgi:TonB-dependent SusC/RagA subfamily outer membrane receptor